MIFLRHELSWFCLVQVSTILFCSFSSFLMSRASDGTDVPVSPVPASSSNMGSPNGSLPDLDGVGGRSTSTMEVNRGLAYQKICPIRGTCRSIGFDSHARSRIHKIRKQYPVTHPISGIYYKQHFKHLNKSLAVSQLVPQPWRPVRPLLQAVLARQTLGTGTKRWLHSHWVPRVPWPRAV